MPMESLVDHEGDDRSMYILNAESPSFTCVTHFSRYVCDKLKTGLS